jgi:hypothetical protein
MSRLVQNSTPAERFIGGSFFERFENASEVVANGGTIVGNPTINRGIELDGTNNYLDYSSVVPAVLYRLPKLSFEIEAAPAFDTNVNSTKFFFGTDTVGNNYYLQKTNNASSNVLKLVVGGTIIADIPEATYSPYWLTNNRNVFLFACESGSNKGWLNGNTILTSNAVSWVPKMPTAFDIGANGSGTSKFEGTFYSFKIFGSLLTEQDAINIYNRKVYDYRNRAVLDLPMRAKEHDPNHQVGSQVLDDNDMEDPGVTNWTAVNNAVVTKITGSLSGWGTRVMKVERDISDYPFVRQTKLTIGKNYMAKGWMTGDGTAYPVVRQGFSTIFEGDASKEPQRVAKVFEATSTDFGLWAYAVGSPGYCLFDDFEVFEVKPVAKDISGEDNYAILGDGSTTTTYPTKLQKRGYSFDGASEYMTVADDNTLDATNALTIAVLFSSVGSGMLVAKNGDSDRPNYALEITSNGNMRFFGYESTTAKGIITDTGGAINNGTPHTVVAMFDGTVWNIFIDGYLYRTASDSATLTPSALSLEIGARNTGTLYDGNILDVTLDNANIWTALQAADYHIRMMQRINEV